MRTIQHLAALAVALSLSACATTRAAATAVKNDVSELWQAVKADGTKLLAAVTATIEADLPTLEADLAGYAKQVGAQAVTDAIAAAAIVLAAKPSTTSAVTVDYTPLPGVVRAQRWAAAQPAI